MRQVLLERDILIAINGPFWVEVAHPEHPFTAMLISRSRGTCLICLRNLPTPIQVGGRGADRVLHVPEVQVQGERELVMRLAPLC